ncbi:MAG TPA: hypothetical protein VFH70_07245, partial [Acidimicrobiales bacterium]|nr:hypothetical protein [Acidimicrobiales bacterium]
SGAENRHQNRSTTMITRTVQQQIRDLIVRTDPDLPPARTTAAQGPFQLARDLIEDQWSLAAPDPDVLAVMFGVLDGFFDQLTDAGLGDLPPVQEQPALFLVAAADLQRWHLRKNTLMAAYAALRTHGLGPVSTPVAGLRPGAKLGSADRRKPRKRVATSDEVLLARVCARLDTRDDLHRRAAALAIGGAGAATGEGAQARWCDVTRPASQIPGGTLALAGRHHHNPANGWHVAARAVDLDAWATTALTDWYTETSSAGRPVQDDWSIVYDGKQALTSQSAKNSYDHHINLTLQAADLAWIPGLTAASIGEWGAAHAGLHHPDGLDQAARVMGVDPMNCLRKLTKASDRAYKPR